MAFDAADLLGSVNCNFMPSHQTSRPRRAQRGAFPVVLDETDVVVIGINAQLAQAVEI